MKNYEIEESDISSFIVKVPEVGSRVSRCMVVNGLVESCEPIIIDGRIVGDIKCNDTVVVKIGAFIEGSIVAKEVKVEGRVEGSIEANLI